MADDPQCVVEELEVVGVVGEHVGADDHLVLPQLRLPHGVVYPRLDREVGSRVVGDHLVAARAAARPRRGEEELGGGCFDPVDGRDGVARGRVHVEVRRFGVDEEGLRVELGVGVIGRHHDVRSEARLGRAQAVFDALDDQRSTEDRHRHEHGEEDQGPRPHGVPAQVHPRKSRQRQHCLIPP